MPHYRARTRATRQVVPAAARTVTAPLLSLSCIEKIVPASAFGSPQGVPVRTGAPLRGHKKVYCGRTPYLGILTLVVCA